MSAGPTFSESDVTVLGWTVPRPTGRWHQSFVVTSRHVWVTPQLAFADNESMTGAAAAGLEAFHGYIRAAGWVTRPPRCNLADVRGINWNETTGWLRVAFADDEFIGAMIPNRSTGNELTPLLKRAIAARRAATTDQA